MTDQFWRPIKTAPKEWQDEWTAGGPVIVLATKSGARWLGYWGKGIRNTEPTWIGLHDHRPLACAKNLAWWYPVPDAPRPTVENEAAPG